MLVSKRVWSDNNYGEIHQETSCGFISMWQKMVGVCLIIASAPRKIFRAYVGTTWHNTRTSPATEFGHHHFWLRRPCRYWHVDKWPGNELSLRPVLECETVPEICCLWGSNSTHIHAVIVCYCWSWKTTRHLACDLLVDEISVSISPLAQ